MLPKSENINDAESLISFIDESGIFPNRCSDLDPILAPSYVNIECDSDDFRIAFLEYTRKNGEYALQNFQNMRFEDPFDDDEAYIESMTDEGRVSLIDVNEPRYGAYTTEKYEKIRFYYEIDFDLLEKAFSESVDFEFSEFIDFMEEWREFWRYDEDPLLNLNDMPISVEGIDLIKANAFSSFANNIFSLFKEKMNSFNREWTCIESSQEAFHFCLGKGIYNIVYASKSHDRKSWDFIEFVCDD